MINYKKPIIVIAGPTASGKSAIALKLAKKINGYIINGDSRQIYKELKIGTAQPKPDKVKNDVWYIDGIKHYLYGHVSAKENYSLFQYQKDVQDVLKKEDSIPILVGGTGLYIDSIVYNYKLKKDKNRKTEYSRKELEKMSVKELQSLLDKETLKKLNKSDIKNPIRLIRAIERGGINKDTGEHLNYIYFLLDPKIETLESKIKQRVDLMFEDGLVEENKQLVSKGFNYKMYSMQTIGYQEFKGYFEKKKTLDQVKDEIVLHTIQYAKRQKTWFKRNKNTIKVKGFKKIYKMTLNFLSTS
jgi:tRNA dimethylallyltransferase